MLKRILVFPCGSEIGLEIHRALCFAKEVDLFGGSSVDDHGRYAFANYIGGLPFTNDENFIEKLNAVIRDYRIDYIFPAHDDTLLRLSKEAMLGNLGCGLLSSSFDVCRICRSKALTMKAFEDILPTPRVYASIDEIDKYPVFLKPDVGQGSKGTAIAKSRQECEYHLSRNANLLILEYLGGPEFTVDCFTDRNGSLVFAGARERLRISNGISVNTRPVGDSEFTEYAGIINKALDFNGVWFYQVKRNSKNELALMEIAPRIAGAMGMHRAMGVNFALMSLYNAEGYDVAPLVNHVEIEHDSALESRSYMKLRYGHVYIDLDDCLILRDQVNSDAVKFIYQCLNRGVGVHLVTRHRDSIDETLRRHRLSGLFDSILHIKDNSPKSSAIVHRDSIFIDDSFSERQEVRASLGIPVFAPDSIPSLMN